MALKKPEFLNDEKFSEAIDGALDILDLLPEREREQVKKNVIRNVKAFRDTRYEERSHRDRRDAFIKVVDHTALLQKALKALSEHDLFSLGCHLGSSPNAFGSADLSKYQVLGGIPNFDYEKSLVAEKLTDLERAARIMANRLSHKKGGPPVDHTDIMITDSCLPLFQKYCSLPVSTTEGGAFRTFVSYIYFAIFGCEKDLERSVKKVVRESLKNEVDLHRKNFGTKPDTKK